MKPFIHSSFIFIYYEQSFGTSTQGHMGMFIKVSRDEADSWCVRIKDKRGTQDWKDTHLGKEGDEFLTRVSK